MISAANIQVDALRAACINLIDYMEKANEVFKKIIQENNVELRWDEFCREKGEIISLLDLREMVSSLGEYQMIEAEVQIR